MFAAALLSLALVFVLFVPSAATASVISSFQMQAIAEGGAPATLAGSHPYEMTAKISMRPEGPGPYTEGDLRDFNLELPPGLIENPGALPKCGTADFHTNRVSPFEASLAGENCPAFTQIGTATVRSSFGGGATRTFGVFNLVPAPGVAAQIGFAPYGAPIVLSARLRGTAGEYGIDLEARNFTELFDLSELQLTIWGTPWGVSHNGERGNCLNEAEPSLPWAKCSVGPPIGHPPEAYLTMPTSCGGQLTFNLSATSWQGVLETASSSAPGIQGCDSLTFDPHPVGQLVSTRTTSPSGYEFDLDVDNSTLLEPSRRVSSQVRQAVVSLPAGVTINPSVGAGLAACTADQYAAETATSLPGAGCPNASKIGVLTVSTPLIEERLQGAIYLAAPHENPYGSLVALYLVAKAPGRGVLIKIPGKIDTDPASGSLTATFDDLPQLPYGNLVVQFRESQRAPLVSPPTCGAATTRTTLTPWLGALGAAERETATRITAGIGGGPCPAGVPPFNPRATGGSVNSAAGSYSPFYLHLTRTDGDAEITSYSATFPPGMTGKLAGIPYCSDAALAAAAHRSGVEELKHPSCPAASQIGHTLAGYGVGSALTYAHGALYLAGPYHGSAFSVVAIDSAIVGPFDLGVIEVRSAIRVDPGTAQVSIDSAGSDPIPHILDGIPLHLRDIRIYISRPETTLNPTSCDPTTLSSSLSGSYAPFTNRFGAAATANVHYQALGCGSLGFAPKLSLRLLGQTNRGGHPKLRAEVTERSGDANISSAVVALPSSEFLAQNHLRGICTTAQLAYGRCPAKSVYGKAIAYTPLLAEPLRGPVYLVVSKNKLPDMVVPLTGNGISVLLRGKIDSSAAGGLRASFEGLPDAPASRFVMTLNGGRGGLLENSADACKLRAFASANFTGHAGRGVALRVPLRAQCDKEGKGKKGGSKTNGKTQNHGKSGRTR
jgi:hypothetical protein